MAKVNKITKKRGRQPKDGGANPLIGVRVEPEFLAWLDDWRRQLSDMPSRPEALRRLAAMGRAAVKQR